MEKPIWFSPDNYTLVNLEGARVVEICCAEPEEDDSNQLETPDIDAEDFETPLCGQVSPDDETHETDPVEPIYYLDIRYADGQRHVVDMLNVNTDEDAQSVMLHALNSLIKAQL